MTVGARMFGCLVLLWAGLSTTEGPKTARAVVKEVVKEAVEQMRAQGLTARTRSN